MKKIKASVLFLAALFAANFSKAQTLEDGKKFLYYEKYKSATDAFQAVINANPNNTEAVYWLGQTMLRPEEKNVAGAKALYLKALETNTNNALLLAGVGHAELLEGKSQDARSHFETAISLSKGKDIAVLNAIGFANADFDSKAGDAGYAIEKLKQATQIKGFKDPDVYVNLGDAYRKLVDGANAILSYQSALALDPKYARATYRIGRIYQTQGAQNVDVMMQYYNQAIAMDPNYTPVYYTLYQYNYQINVPKSAEYLDKYLNALGTNDATDACYLRASILFAQALYQQTIDKAKECTGSANVNPATYGLIAFSYYKLNDSTNAKLAFDEYFQKQKPEKLGPGDYTTYADVLSKFPGNESIVATYYDKAISMDSTEAGKVGTLKDLAKKAEAKKDYKTAADWYNKILTVKKDPTKTDLYYAGYNYYLAGQYEPAISIFNTYIQRFPDESFGFYMNGKSYAKIDSLNTTQDAISNYLKVINMADLIKDKAGEKDRIKGSFRYAVEYYANVKGNKDSAIYYVDKAIAFDPADTDYGFADMKEQLKNMSNKPPTTPRPGTLPTGTTIGKNGEKVTIAPDGTITTVEKDGTTSIITKSGKVTQIKNGVTTIIENGKITTIGKDGKTTTIAAPPKPTNPPKK